MLGQNVRNDLNPKSVAALLVVLIDSHSALAVFRLYLRVEKHQNFIRMGVMVRWAEK